uniref:Ribonuclease H-like domain-containing protein n=1 Tax=Tanacetum cinerariifolium TaxID=118510 RepID=A0A6L2M825_TANCI|nr:ribonuclease H-like domain-containing protein [Tanacetum cinerariifolium]
MHDPSNTSATSTQTVPTPFTPDELKVDKIVLSWIFKTLSDSFQARLLVARPRSAKEGWDILSDIIKYNKRSRTNALKAELRSIKLGDQSMEAYFQKIESIVTILASLDSHVNDEDVVHSARGDAIKVHVYISTRRFIVCFSYGAHGRFRRNKNNNNVPIVPTSNVSGPNFLTQWVLLQCDSTGDLYPVISPFLVPQAFLVSSHTWHQRLGHPRSDVLRHLVSNNFISCNKEKPPVLCHACQLGKHVKLSFTVLSLATSRHWPIHQLDVKNTILHGDLFKTVYMYRHHGFRDFVHPDHVCLLQRQGAYTAYLLLYVDDIVLTTSSDTLLRRIIASLHQEFSMTDLGSLNYFLGIYVTRDSSRMFLSQKKYAIEILERAHMVNCNPSQTPIYNESKLENDGDSVSDPTLYQSLVGYLLYLTFTRLNISYAVQQTWWLILMLIGLVALLLDVRLLVTVYFLATTFYLGPLSVSRGYLIPVLEKSIVVLLTLLLGLHQHTKHIEIDIHFVRDLVAAGQVRVLHVSSRYQFADIFTKGLPSALFEEFRYSLSVRSPPAPTAREC